MRPVHALTVVLLVAAFWQPALVLADEKDDHRLPPVSNAAWKAECGSCHMLYPPGFLPERSWRKLMSGLDKHFGASAELDSALQKDITQFLTKHSAQGGSKYAKSIPATATPLRISETTWFKREHREVRPDVWKRAKIGSPSNCVACHQAAEQGDFSEDKIAIPR